MVPGHKCCCQTDKQKSQWEQSHTPGIGCLFTPPSVPFLLYLPLLCQAPLQVSVPRLAGVQLRLQLLPRLTDRAHSQSESQPTADWRHTDSFVSECNSSNVGRNRMLFTVSVLFKVAGILRLIYCRTGQVRIKTINFKQRIVLIERQSTMMQCLLWPVSTYIPKLNP